MAVPRPCPRSVVYRDFAGMQADEKPWLQHGNAPHHAYFVDRIRKTSIGLAGPGMKFDGIAVCGAANPDPFGRSINATCFHDATRTSDKQVRE